MAMNGDNKCRDNPELPQNVDGNYEFDVDVLPKMNNWINGYVILIKKYNNYPYHRETT